MLMKKLLIIEEDYAVVFSIVTEKLYESSYLTKVKEKIFELLFGESVFLLAYITVVVRMLSPNFPIMCTV